MPTPSVKLENNNFVNYLLIVCNQFIQKIYGKSRENGLEIVQ